jgi:hypothetical protein
MYFSMVPPGGVPQGGGTPTASNTTVVVPPPREKKISVITVRNIQLLHLNSCCARKPIPLYHFLSRNRTRMGIPLI